MRSRIIKYLDVIVEHMIYGVIFFIPISTSIIGIFAGMAIALFLIKKILSSDFTGIKANRTFFILLSLFFVFMSLSLFNSGPLFTKSLKALLIKWGRFPILLWVIIDTFRDTRRIINGMCVLIFSAALLGLTVFTQRFFGFEFLRGRASLGYSLPSIGPFKNQNSLAAYLSCVIPIILAFSFGLWKKVKTVVRVPLFLVTGLLILSSVWATSRGGLLGIIAGFIFIILVISYPRIKRVFWPVFLFNCLFVWMMGLTLFLYQSRGDSNRFILYRGAWEMIKEHPLLGKGIGTFMDYCAIYTNNFGTYYAHNCYLQIWAESGIFSLLSFLLLVGYVFYKALKVILELPKSLSYYILIGLNAGLLGFLVHSFFEVNFYSFQHAFLFWAVLGLTVALTQKMRTQGACPGRGGGGRCST